MSDYIDSYYFGFQATGVAPVDDILMAVARAGKSFHSTDMWEEKIDYMDNKSATDWIQEAAANCAEHIATLEARVKELEDK